MQLSLFDKFEKYHIENPHIYRMFKQFTFKTIKRGFKHYGAKGIFEIIRWHSSVRGNDEWKINNNYTPFYARKFEENHPRYKNFFYKRKSKFD